MEHECDQFSGLFHAYELLAEKIGLFRRLSRGIVFFVRKTLKDYVNGYVIGQNVVCIVFDKSILDLDKDLLVVCVYINPCGSGCGISLLFVSLVDVLHKFGGGRVA